MIFFSPITENFSKLPLFIIEINLLKIISHEEIQKHFTHYCNIITRLLLLSDSFGKDDAERNSKTRNHH